jgi:hypothetical protein
MLFGPVGSAIHRTVGVGAGIGVPLEFSDRLVDPAGVAADRTIDESGRVVEIVGSGQRVGVLSPRH